MNSNELIFAIACVIGVVLVIWIVSMAYLKVARSPGTWRVSPTESENLQPRNQVVTLELKIVGGSNGAANLSVGAAGADTASQEEPATAPAKAPAVAGENMLDQLVKRITAYEQGSSRQLIASMDSITAKALNLRSVSFEAIDVDNLFRFENVGELIETTNTGYLIVQKNFLLNTSTKNFETGLGNSPDQMSKYVNTVLADLKEDEDVRLLVSPASMLTLPDDKKRMARIPQHATHYCYCYPVAASMSWPEGVTPDDALLDLLHYGGFLYFDNSTDTSKIAAINACCIGGEPDCKLFLSDCLPMPQAPAIALQASGRLKPVTLWSSDKSTIEHGWVIPNEKVGGKQFTRNGGFAYVYTDKNTGEQDSFFFPVLGGQSKNIRYELTDAREKVYFKELQVCKTEEEQRDSKFCNTTFSMVTGLDMGLSSNASIHFLLGISKAQLRTIQRTGLKAIEEEWMALVGMKRGSSGERVHEALTYALGVAREEIIVGNQGERVLRDEGRDGYTLERFHNLEQCQKAKLVLAEVLALRLYTSTAFREINRPLRARASCTDSTQWASTPVPLPATTYFISSAVTKLQELSRENFKPFELWRGLGNMKDLTSDYMKSGGQELACMSTSASKYQSLLYAKSRRPMIMRLRVVTHRNVGADISFVSMFPGEKEFLYPPLTHLKPVQDADLVSSTNKVIGKLVTVIPSFPNIDLADAEDQDPITTTIMEIEN